MRRLVEAALFWLIIEPLERMADALASAAEDCNNA
jgi:hypothetical protein